MPVALSYAGISALMKCSSKFFTYELSRTKTIEVGLAWAWREMKGPAATPAAPPAASFRKSRRVAFDRVGCAIAFPPVCDVDGPWKTPAASVRPGAKTLGSSDTADSGAQDRSARIRFLIVPSGQARRQGLRGPLPRTGAGARCSWQWT